MHNTRLLKSNKFSLLWAKNRLKDRISIQGKYGK